MPLVAHTDLPAFDRIRDEGVSVAHPDEVAGSELPEIHVGLLNLMPDLALRATDRQFARLVASYGESANIWLHVFGLGVDSRGSAAREHIDNHYETFEEVRSRHIDALIVTGANPMYVDMTREAFWPELVDVFEWADHSVASTLCSCWATHAVFKIYWGVERVRLPEKMWGVYSHDLVASHPLLSGLESPVIAPHSHFFDLASEPIESVGAAVLMRSDEAGVHMAVHDEAGFVFFQGHPEYDAISLLKEYKREVWRYLTDQRETYPPLPDHYFDELAIERLTAYRAEVDRAPGPASVPEFPESQIAGDLGSPWRHAGQIIYRNWLRGLETSGGH